MKNEIRISIKDFYHEFSDNCFDFFIDLYVDDSDNHRIILFRSRQNTDVVVAGEGIPANLILNLPMDVILDA